MANSKAYNQLNAKQRRFCEEYIKDLNATQAYIRAGYAPNSAHVEACKALMKPKFQDYIAELAKARSERTETEADWVLKRLKQNDEAAFANEEYGHSNKALELIGRHNEMFGGKKNEDTKVEIVVKMPGDE